MPRRLVSFALLVFAVLGYGALPSSSPSELFRTQWTAAAVDGSCDDPHRLIAPGQAKEYRSRILLAVSRSADGDPQPAFLDVSVDALGEPAVMLAQPLEQPLLHGFDFGGTPGPRAPPSFPMS